MSFLLHIVLVTAALRSSVGAVGGGWAGRRELLGRQDMAASGPCVIEGRHGFHFFGVARRQIVEFCPVHLGIIKLPVVLIEGDQLPSVQPNCAVAFMLPENGGRMRTRF